MKLRKIMVLEKMARRSKVIQILDLDAQKEIRISQDLNIP
jgi:hypothetical protein